MVGECRWGAGRYLFRQLSLYGGEYPGGNSRGGDGLPANFLYIWTIVEYTSRDHLAGLESWLVGGDLSSQIEEI